MFIKNVFFFYRTGCSKFLFLAFCWTILLFSSNEISAASSGNYHYDPSFTATGSNYIDTSSSGSLQLSTFSVAAWFKTSGDYSTDAMIVNKGGVGSDSAGENMNYGIWMTSAEKIRAGFESSTGADFFATSPSTYNDNQWHYAVVTYGGNSVLLYIDGAQVASFSASGQSPEKSGIKPVRIGANSRITPPGNFFIGNIDEVRVWNDDLTPTEVSNAFTGSSFNTAEQVLYLSFTSGGSGTYHYDPSFTATGSNYIDTANSGSLQLSQFSVAAWFKTSADYSTDAMIVNKGGLGSESAGENMNYGIWMTSTEQIRAGFETTGTAADRFATSPNKYNDGQWHYVVVTFGGTTVLLYIDGTQVGSFPATGESPESSGIKPVRVGANSRITPPGNFFIGSIDEVRVWNDDLTPTEVSNAFTGISFNTAEQVLYVSGSSTDIFGIKKLYATKSGGEEWYMNMNNPLSDSRFNPQNTITKNPDGSWKMKSTKVRMAVYTSTGFDPNDIPTLDHSIIASKGYMLAPNDWRNFEMTQYVKVNTSPSDDNFSPNGRGGRHTGDGTPPVGCEGSSMKGDVFFSGKVRFAKEQWHVSYVFTNLKTATSSIEDKWVGIKFVVYNFVENGEVVVKTELWLDTNNNGNFVKVDENVDRGGWGTEDGQCGGAPDQIISWGGPITTFRWDTATDVDFKNLSVREIVPPQ
jgi:concanavalin A-like lectin/glucanase superfamily protein